MIGLINPLSVCFWLFGELRLCGSSVSRHIVCEFMTAVVMLCLGDSILQPPFPIFCLFCSFCFVFWMILGPQGISVSVLFSANPSTVLYFQHVVQPWIFALTSMHCNERLLLIMLKAALRRWLNAMSIHLWNMPSDLFSHEFWIRFTILGMNGLLLGWALRSVMEQLTTFLGTMTVLYKWDTSCLTVSIIAHRVRVCLRTFMI